MVGGLEWKVHYLATAYRARGHAVVVLCGLDRFRRRGEVQVEQPYPVIRFAVHLQGMDYLRINSMLGYLALRKAHRRTRFDAVHAHSITYPGDCAVAFQRRTGVPAVLTPTGGDVQSVASIDYGVRLDGRWDRQMRENVRQAAAVTAINFDMAEELARLGARRRPPYIPNGVLWEQFQGPRTDALARRLGLEPGRFIFLGVGRNMPVKGYPDMLEAFAEVCRRDRRPVLVLVGRNVPSLRPQVEALGLAGRVFLIDQLPMSELPAVFRSADVFVSTSLMEGFPQVVAQALASGLPCVLSDNPGHRAVASVGGARVVAQKGAIPMAEAMLGLLENRAEAAALSEAGREGSRAYDWNAIAAQYLQLIEEVRAESC